MKLRIEVINMEYTREMVIKKIKQVFPEHPYDYVMAALNLYGQMDSEYEKERVQLAILKLTQENKDNFCKHIVHAKLDYRDILAAAEYPGQMADTRGLNQISKIGKQKIEDQDRKQYLDWLNH